MSREVINVGAAPNDGQGDPIRTSFIKTNNNFGELYARAQENPPATLVGTVGDAAGMYAYDSTYFYYCFQDYDGSSVIWAQITNDALFTVTEIINGTSSINIPTANGNITVSVANVANVAVFSSGGANFTAITASSAVINGDLTVTGNATLSGNIVGDRITNGTTSIEIPAANGNATVTVGGTANVAVFTTSGLVANEVSAIGNVVGGNITTAGQIIATGNLTSGNLSAVGNIFSAANILGGNLLIPINANIRGEFSVAPFFGRTVFKTTNATANGTTYISAVPGDLNSNVIAAGFGAYTSADLANSAVFGVYSYANQGAIRSISIGSATTNPITFLFDGTEVARFTTSGNLGIGNTAPVDPLAVTGTAYVSGNLTGGNLVTAGVVSAATLSVNGTSTFAGNLIPTANITYDIGNATNRWNDIWLANSTIHIGNAQISANASAVAITSPSGGTLSITGTSANLATPGTLTGANITTGGVISATGNISTTGIFIGNGSGITGVVAVGNVGAASQFTNGTTNLNIPVADGNIVGNINGVPDLFQFSTLGFSAAGNITGGNINTGGLITATGNISGGNLHATGLMSAAGNITSGGVFVGDGSGLTNLVANVGSASQLTSGTTQINIPVANGNIVANVNGSTNLFQWSTVGFSAQGNITGGNIVTAGVATVTGNVTGGNILTIGSVSAAGNLSGSNLNITGNIVDTGPMRLITGASGAISLAPNASNVLVVTTGGATLFGAGNVTGNLTGGNLLTAGLVSSTGNITGNYILGNGSQLTGLPATYDNSNVATFLAAFGSNAISTTGNISANVVSVVSIENSNANGVGNIGTTATRFNTVFALASSAQYADLAEYYLADTHYPAGTVVAFGGARELTICNQDHDVTVAGIVSDRPAFEMNAGIKGDHPVALALAGRVPCRVIGPIQRGQMLVSAGQGRARAESTPSMGAVIGKALEDFDGTTGTIEVVVGRI